MGLVGAHCGHTRQIHEVSMGWGARDGAKQALVRLTVYRYMYNNEHKDVNVKW